MTAKGATWDHLRIVDPTSRKNCRSPDSVGPLLFVRNASGEAGGRWGREVSLDS